MLPKIKPQAPCIVRIGKTTIYLRTTDGRRFLVSEHGLQSEIDTFLSNAFLGKNGLSRSISLEYQEAVRNEDPVYDLPIRSGIQEIPQPPPSDDGEDDDDVAS